MTISFADPELDDEEKEENAQQLFRELRDIEEVDSVKRVLDPNPPEGNKAFGATLMGLLTAEVSIENCKKLLGFLGDRLGGKPIELEVEANGKKLKVSAHSRQELESAIKVAQDFVST
jgi:hypothetical protein